VPRRHTSTGLSRQPGGCCAAGDFIQTDVLALTKLNYNAYTYGEGEPVTLKLADAVGEILTAGPVSGAPLPCRLYI
jgi:hypothetical protein